MALLRTHAGNVAGVWERLAPVLSVVLVVTWPGRLDTWPADRYADAMSESNTEVPVFDGPDGLVTAVAQDAATGQVLMVAHMNRAAWAETLATGRAVYFSRSRGRLWRKGEESGHVQHVRSVFVDCDGDAVLLKVEQVGGAACHEGYASCFFREVTPDGVRLVAERVFDPGTVYGKKVSK